MTPFQKWLLFSVSTLLVASGAGLASHRSLWTDEPALAATRREPELLFKSGFEEGVSLSPIYGHSGTAAWQDIRGTDSVSGYSWPIKVWNPTVSAMQLLVNDPSAVKNTIESTIGHDGTSTRALHTQLLRASGEFPQDPYYLSGLRPSGVGTLYIAYWIRFDPNLLQQMGPNQWQALFEWKTAGDYREIVFIYTDANGEPYWHVQEDNNANGGLPYKQFWAVDNTSVRVPVGEWFSFETFVHRSAGADGRIWTAINGEIVADHRGGNIGVDNAPIDRVMLFQNYGGGAKPIGQWVDDVEIWDKPPCVAPPCLRPPLAVRAMPQGRGAAIKP